MPAIASPWHRLGVAGKPWLRQRVAGAVGHVATGVTHLAAAVLWQAEQPGSPAAYDAMSTCSLDLRVAGL